MGLLDDAIREHLELKRRHGADAAEVARQEQEALGPARRGPEPLDVSTAEAPAEAAADPALMEAQVDAPVHHEPDEPQEHPTELHGAVAMGDASFDVPEPAAEAPAPPVTPERSEALDVEPEIDADVDWEAPPRPPAPEHPPAPERPAAPEPPPSAGQPTVAFDAADVEEAQRRPDREPDPESPAPAAGPDEDVLEETPDFLQETPEHDRLWFEQRPPRDFDFDG